MPFKNIWYDWLGYNQWFFNLIYGSKVETLRPLFPLLDFVGEYTHFHYLLFFTTAMFVVKYATRTATGRSTGSYVIRSYAAWLCALVVSFGIMALIVGGLKEYLHLARPYHALSHVHLLYQGGVVGENDAFRSFPSGHVAFTALWVTMLWSQVWLILKLPLAVMLITMCWFRIAIGAHFPMDVLTSLCIGMFIAGFCRTRFRKWFKVWR